MYLFIDTETTGLPRNFRAPVSDLNNWPRLIQAAWLEFDTDGTETYRASKIITPTGFTIPDDAVKIHGITTAMAMERGEPLHDVLESIYLSAQDAECIVGHNISFDLNILGAEFLRCDMENPLASKPLFCTMQETTDFCKLPGRRDSYKWPTLAELYTSVFGTSFEGAHDALVDIEATADCYWELRRRSILKP